MYGSLRFKAGFREEVDKFVEAAKKHATTLKENKDTISCPCKDLQQPYGMDRCDYHQITFDYARIC